MEYRLVTAHIDLGAIEKNVIRLKRLTGPGVIFMAVVKADGYGHGAVKVAEKALKSGAGWLGVARLDEAVSLRRAGISAPVLVFGYVPPEQAVTAAGLDLTISLYGFEMAQALSEQAGKAGLQLDAHLKVDTGMGRVGMIVDPADRDPGGLKRNAVLTEIEKTAGLPGIRLKGIYTHFAAADHPDRSYTDRQIGLFESLLSDLGKRGIEFECRHAANSAGIIAFPSARFDMVRAGISLYGLYPSAAADRARVELVPAMTLTSLVTGVRDVPEGFCVSYGMTHVTKTGTRLASVPVGYADGFSRCFSSNGHMLVRGKRAPIVGRVCMDQTMIDVGHIQGVAPGDPVVLMGRQADAVIGADELAETAGTIHYEIVSALTSRVKRVYPDSGAGSG